MDHAAELNEFARLQRGMADIHPLLGDAKSGGGQRMAVVDAGVIRVYRAVSPSTDHTLIAQAKAPDGLPGDFLACVEVEESPGRPSLVFGRALLQTHAGMARLIGAAVRCELMASWEARAQRRLGGCQPNAAWALDLFETSHDTAWLYRTLVAALMASAEHERIARLRIELRALCLKDVWHTVILNEWRQGLGRYVENRARERLGLASIPSDAEPGWADLPGDERRIVNGGAALIAWLEAHSPGLCHRPLELLDSMLAIGADRDAQPESSTCL